MILPSIHKPPLAPPIHRNPKRGLISFSSIPKSGFSSSQFPSFFFAGFIRLWLAALPRLATGGEKYRFLASPPGGYSFYDPLRRITTTSEGERAIRGGDQTCSLDGRGKTRILTPSGVLFVQSLFTTPWSLITFLMNCFLFRNLHTMASSWTENL